MLKHGGHDTEPKVIYECSALIYFIAQGICMLTFPDRENTGNLVNLIFYTGKNLKFRLKKNANKLATSDGAFLCYMVACSCHRKLNV